LNAGIRWLVSGTPIQNRREDMYNLCRLIRIPYKDPDSRLDILRNFVLRRTKKEVGILLPEVVEGMNVVSWENEREKKLAESIHSKLSICRKQDKDTDKDEPNKENVLDFTPLQAMLKARQCCILPRLVQANPSVSSSSKLDFVVGEILRNKGNGSGKLIFCHFREELDEICKRLTASGLNGVACIDSRTSDVRRKQCLVENNEALVLQIQTGCEGLNLQEHYSEIYFVGPHWNPAIEDQAVARCHRFGQTRVVYVRRFEMASFGNQDINIERYVHNVQESKRIMAQEYFP
jgi:SNF2 family DNA or RNA helicase